MNKTEKISELLLTAELLSSSDNLFGQVKLYKEVLTLDENNIEALINLSDCFIRMSLEDRATLYARQAYLLHRHSDDMAAVNYSCVLMETKDYQKAIEILEEEKSADSQNHLIYNNLGYSYFLTSQFDNALANYDISISIEEENPMAYYNRGYLRYFIFNDDDGIFDLQKAHFLGDFDAGIILQQIIKDKSLLS